MPGGDVCLRSQERQVAIYERPLSQNSCSDGPVHPLEPSQGLFHEEEGRAALQREAEDGST